jgi:hypothetical protein
MERRVVVPVCSMVEEAVLLGQRQSYSSKFVSVIISPSLLFWDITIFSTFKGHINTTDYLGTLEPTAWYISNFYARHRPRVRLNNRSNILCSMKKSLKVSSSEEWWKFAFDDSCAMVNQWLCIYTAENRNQGPVWTITGYFSKVRVYC